MCISVPLMKKSDMFSTLNFQDFQDLFQHNKNIYMFHIKVKLLHWTHNHLVNYL